MMTKTFKADKLTVNVYDNRKNLGIAAAAAIASCIKDLLKVKPEIYIIFAAAPSQNEMLEALVSDKEIEWNRIHALHMDEYVNLPADAPQGFGNFLKRAIFDHVPFASVELIGTDADSEAACLRYNKILEENIVDIVLLGIGENGHIAFNDPHVADFNDPLRIKKVDLDNKCRQQQVNDGCFETIDQVPTHALTLTVPTLYNVENAFCVVPTKAKAEAIRKTVMGPIDESCPASIMRTHNNVTLYIDTDSASLL